MAPRHRAPSAAQPSCPALLGTRRPARTRPSMASNNRAYPRRPPALLGAAHGDPVDQERKRDDPTLVLLGSPCGPQGRGHGCPRASRRHGMRHRETPAPPHEPGRLHLPGGPLGCRSLYSGHPALRPFGAASPFAPLLRRSAYFLLDKQEKAGRPPLRRSKPHESAKSINEGSRSPGRGETDDHGRSIRCRTSSCTPQRSRKSSVSSW